MQIPRPSAGACAKLILITAFVSFSGLERERSPVRKGVQERHHAVRDLIVFSSGFPYYIVRIPRIFWFRFRSLAIRFASGSARFESGRSALPRAVHVNVLGCA